MTNLYNEIKSVYDNEDYKLVKDYKGLEIEISFLQQNQTIYISAIDDNLQRVCEFENLHPKKASEILNACITKYFKKRGL